MIKWLLVVGVVGLIYFMFIKKKPAVSASKKFDEKTDIKDEKIDSNDMVECATCSIYCELDEALLSNNKYYCSKECLEKA